MAQKFALPKKKGDKPPPGPGGRPHGAVGREDAAEKAVEEAYSGDRLLQACGSDLGADGAAEIVDALWEVDKPLFSLNLRGGSVGADGAALLAEVLGQCHGPLRKLDLSNNDIYDDGACTLADELGHHSALRTLLLRSNEIKDRGAAAIAGIIHHHRALQEVHLGGNKLGPNAAEAFAEVLQHPALQVLGLEGNPITDAGAAHLAKALSQRPLPAPSPAGPPLPPPGGAIVRRAPPPLVGGGRLGNVMRARGQTDTNQPGLRVLQLSNCNLTDVAAKAFAETMETQREGPLRELHLGFNKITDMGGKRLAEALEGHESLRVLFLEGNLIGDAASLRFVAALSRMAREDIHVNLAGNKPKRAGQRGAIKSSRFDEAALGDLIRVAKTVKALASRGVTFGRLLKFYTEQVAAGKIDPTLSSTREVVNKVIAPETKEFWSSFSVFFNKPQPDVYVIHAWGALFHDLVAAVARHATGLLNPKMDPDNVYYDRNPEVLDKCYFIDAMSINQNKAQGVLDARCESDKFEMVMHLVHLRGGESIVAMDAEWTPLTRMWCLTEVHQCLVEQMHLSVSFGVHCPLPLARRGWGDIEKAETSREEDRQILRCVLGDKGQPNALNGPSKLVQHGLTALIVERFQADRKVMPQDMLLELEILEEQIDKDEEAKALMIQRNMRGFWGRRYARQRRHQRREKAALIIQAFRRELLVKRRERLELSSATRIQRWWRDVPRGLQKRRDQRAEEAARLARKAAEQEEKRKRFVKKMASLLEAVVQYCEISDIGACARTCTAVKLLEEEQHKSVELEASAYVEDTEKGSVTEGLAEDRVPADSSSGVAKDG